MRIAHLDAFAGVAGDMWAGALVDLGVDFATIARGVGTLALERVRVRVEPVSRAGMRATRFLVDVDDSEARTHRHLDDLKAIVARGALPDPVRTRVLRVFERLAAAEAEVHGCAVEEVHFHEVGADDTIVDVVAVCLGMHELDVGRVHASRVTTGTGTVRCAHGELPVPAPGTEVLLRGVPVRGGGIVGECTTPTGAALLREFVDEFDADLEWTIERSGHGAGARDDAGRPNLLRISVGSVAAGGDHSALTEVSCNVDTATGETIGFLIARVLQCGAVDAWVTPVVMKKGRPGHVFSALVAPAERDAVVRVLLEESSSLGVRMHAVRRQVVERWSEVVETRWGAVRVKSARLPSGRVWRRVEADELTRLTHSTGVPRGELERAIARVVDGDGV